MSNIVTNRNYIIEPAVFTVHFDPAPAVLPSKLLPLPSLPRVFNVFIERGIATVSRLSVRPSMTLMYFGHISLVSSKVITRLN